VTASVAPLNRTLEQELVALARGASLECLVCGEFVLIRGGEVECPQCGLSLRGESVAKVGLQSDLQAG